MNKENLKLLVEELKEPTIIPNLEFGYRTYFTGNDKLIDQVFEKGSAKEVNFCDSTACVAGTTCLLFPDALDPSTFWCRNNFEYDRYATKVLDLSNAENQFLFHEFCGVAEKEDAIKRLEWLINGNSILDYPWEEESHYKTDSEESRSESQYEINTVRSYYKRIILTDNK